MPTWYLSDVHGDTVGSVSASATISATSAFDPFGKVMAQTGVAPVFGYQSDLTDPTTAQVDMGTRWYEAGLGRFSTRDVVFGTPTAPVSLNTWAYGGANPVTMVDPTGMRAVTLHEGGCGSLGEKDCRDAVDSFIEHEDEDPGYWAGNFTGLPKAAPPPPEIVTTRQILEVPNGSAFLTYGPGAYRLDHVVATITEFRSDDASWWSIAVTTGGRFFHNEAAEDVGDGVGVQAIDAAGRAEDLTRYPNRCYHDRNCEPGQSLSPAGNSSFFFEGHPLQERPTAILIKYTSLSCQTEGCLYLPDLYANEVVIPLAP